MFLAAGAFLNPGRSRNSRSGYGPPQKDRFAGMGVLAATTGMRRSELLGIRRDSPRSRRWVAHDRRDLILMAGRAEESDDRTQPGVFLDAFMIAALRQHLAVLEPSAKPRPRRYSNSNVTFQIYTHRSTGQERAAADSSAT